ncbi:MAG: hypothetical protein ACPGN3_04865 [Opitutales bacterium]
MQNLKRSYLFFLVPLGYSLFFWVDFLADVLGRYPVLDARENLFWVQRFQGEGLPEEPFYRALLYPWLLSFLPGLPVGALVFGLVVHLVNAWLVAGLAEYLWKSRNAARVGGVLYVMNPVSLFFAVQVLDITLGISFFLGAVISLFRIGRGVDAWGSAVSCGLLIGLATLTRPSFLLVGIALCFLPLVLPFLQKDSKWPLVARSAFIISISFGSLLMTQGVLNQSISGEFRVLPWQGAYNLYAANKTGANGKYFAQAVSFESLPPGVNPTRMESEVLYKQTHPDVETLDIASMSSYWRGRLIEDVTGDPLRWLGLMGRKLVYLFNDWEQYNNLSYAYQKGRFPVLSVNPLGWGVVLLLAFTAVFGAWAKMNKEAFLAILVVASAYAGGVLLFYVSARFRLPLAPLLSVLASGLACLSKDSFRGGSKMVLYIGCVVGLAIFTFGNWANARDESTFIQDKTLLAISANALGEDELALKYSGAVLGEQPARQDMLRIRVTSLFNLWLVEVDEAARAEYWATLGDALEILKSLDASTGFIRGVYAWNVGEREMARRQWAETADRFKDAAIGSKIALSVVTGGAAAHYPSEMVRQIRELLSVPEP